MRRRLARQPGSRGDSGGAVRADRRGARPARGPIGHASAAEAEYRALLLGLELAAANGIEALDVCSDSRLAIAGVQGPGPDRPDLSALAALVRAAAGQFADVGWLWHPRAQNREADALVRDLLW